MLNVEFCRRTYFAKHGLSVMSAHFSFGTLVFIVTILKNLIIFGLLNSCGNSPLMSLRSRCKNLPCHQVCPVSGHRQPTLARGHRSGRHPSRPLLLHSWSSISHRLLPLLHLKLILRRYIELFEFVDIN